MVFMCFLVFEQGVRHRAQTIPAGPPHLCLPLPGSNFDEHETNEEELEQSGHGVGKH